MTHELQIPVEQTAEANVPEVSIVIPCLNEENSIGIVVEKAKRAIEMMGVSGEVIVADNGSTDRSVEIALSTGRD
jgi:glycosyltransferase involved in cell wall biosynthesis